MKIRLFFLVLSLSIAILNTKFNFVYFHDEVIPLSSQFIINYFSTWSVNDFGLPSSGGIPKLISFIFFLPLIESAEITEILIITILTYFSLFYFKKLCDKWFKCSNFESISGALIYIANPFITFYVWRTANLATRFWFFSFLPANLYFLTEYLDGKKPKMLFLFLITHILIIPSFTHPAFVIIYTLIITVILLSNYFALEKDKLKQYSIKVLKVGLLVVFINALWIFPRVFTLSDELQFASSVGLSKSLIKNSDYLNFVNVISGIGFGSLYEKYTWYDWQEYYQSSLVIITGIIVLLIIFSPLLFNVKKDTRYYLFLAIFIVGNILAYGTNASKYILVLFERFPFLYAFRDPGKWYGMTVLFQSLLFVFGLSFLRKNLDLNRFKIKYIPYFISVFIIIILGWPVLFGFATRYPSIDLPGSRIIVPQEYRVANNYLGDDRILILPFIGNHFISDWKKGAYKGVYILRSMTGKSFVTIANPNTKESVERVTESILNGNVDLAQKYNISQVILHHDLKMTEKVRSDYAGMSEKLKNAGYKIVLNNQYFTIYDLFGNARNHRPHIYITKEKETIYWEVPYEKVEFEQKNPTQYKISLKNVSLPVYLNFSESFHPDWKLRAGDFNWLRVIMKKNYFLPDDFHAKNNANLNSFKIDPEFIKQNHPGSYTENPDGSINLDLTLYFKPQSYFYLGLIISSATLVGCLGYLAYDFSKRKRKNFKGEEKSAKVK